VKPNRNDRKPVTKFTKTRRVTGEVFWCDDCYEGRAFMATRFLWRSFAESPLVKGFCPEGHPVTLRGWELSSYRATGPWWWRISVWWWLDLRRWMLVFVSMSRLRQAQREAREFKQIQMSNGRRLPRAAAK
jgi:hypothetical protein